MGVGSLAVLGALPCIAVLLLLLPQSGLQFAVLPHARLLRPVYPHAHTLVRRLLAPAPHHSYERLAGTVGGRAWGLLARYALMALLYGTLSGAGEVFLQGRLGGGGGIDGNTEAAAAAAAAASADNLCSKVTWVASHRMPACLPQVRSRCWPTWARRRWRSCCPAPRPPGCWRGMGAW